MQDYIKDAFERMTLQQTISFLLYGSDDYAEETQPYGETLKQSSDPYTGGWKASIRTASNWIKPPLTSPSP